LNKKDVSPNLSNLLPNAYAVGAVYLQQESEITLVYSICCNSRLHVPTPPTAWRHSSRVAI